MTIPEPQRPRHAVESLAAQRSKFRAFLASRLGSDAEVDDVLQNGLVKVFERVGEMRDEEKLTAWFYQVLRHALVDHVRSRKAATQREQSWVMHETMQNDAEAGHVICGCYESLLPQLRAREAELLRRVELKGEPVATVAADLGITSNNASVSLHRARRELRDRLEQFCGECASGACLDCDC